MSASASVVIPAHNEQRGLRRCLDTLLADARPDEFEILVVANGCTDATAEVAREFAARGVRCLETPVASKAHALTLGDEAADALPRIYLDADIELATSAARALVDELAGDRTLAAAPRLALAERRTTRAARRYLSVWASLPVFDRHYVGSGCYALSAAGRARFGRFPQVMSDDRAIDSMFTAAEKSTLTEHLMLVTPPDSVRAVIRRSLRVRAGRLDLDAENRASPTNRPAKSAATETSGTGRHLIRLCRRPRTFPAVVTFASVQAVVIGLARVRRLTGRDRTWLRDETSRQ